MRLPRRLPPRAGRRPPLVVGAVVALALVTSSCSAVPSWALGGGPSVERLSDGTALLVAQRSSGNRMAALLSGTLTTVNGGCLGFDPPDGSGSVVLVLPHGSRPTGDGTAVKVPGGPTVRIGDSIVGGGGGRDLDGDEGVVASVWPDAPEACRSARCLAGVYDVELDAP